MNIEIVNILKKYGCAYMETDNKEMLEEIENFVNKRETAISVTRCCEELVCDKCDNSGWVWSKLYANNIKCECSN